MTARITDFGNGYIEEVMAPAVALHWDPATNRGSAKFQMERFATMGGALRSRQMVGVLEHVIDPAATPQVFDVPQVNGDGTPVLDGEGEPVIMQLSSVQIMVVMKACFDRLYNDAFGTPAP